MMVSARGVFCLSLLFTFALFVSAIQISSDDDRDSQIVKALNDIFHKRLLAEEANGLSALLNDLKLLSDEVIATKSNEEIAGGGNRVDDYFLCLPSYLTFLNPSVSFVTTWSTPCFNNNTAVTAWGKLGMHIQLTISDPVTDPQGNSTECKDFYFFADLGFSETHHLGAGHHSLTWSTAVTPEAVRWDLETNGLRIFRFPVGPEAALENFGQTFALFEPMIVGPGVNVESQLMNAEFLRHYPQFPFPNRPAKSRQVAVDESLIHSGDFIGVIRFDGLDPMIAWGMGGTTGHTAIAMWENGELYIMESTVKSVYWPTNGIQKTPYQQWINQSNMADYNFVWVPLAPEYSTKFNVTAALEFFNMTEGMPYGYHNFIFGWVDTQEDNFPCLPPNYTFCLTYDLVFVASGLVDRIDKAIGNLMWNQAFSHRLGIPLDSINSTAGILQYAAIEKGLTFGDLLTMPEQDGWYYTNPDGLSMVCDVFVCSMWKAGGLFGDLADSIQCTELTPWDVYSLKFFDGNFTLPKECAKADPKLPYCQLNGRYELILYDYNTKEPYPNMAQNCPGVPPQYIRPANC